MKHFTLLLIILAILSAAACSQDADQYDQNGPTSVLSTAATSSPVLTTSPSPNTTLAPYPTPAELSALPEDYKPEEAAANGDYVEVHGTKFYNEDKLSVFLRNVYAKKEAAIRLVSYTTEGDAIISDVFYDGSQFTVDCDTTRDQFGKKEIAHYEYLNLFEYVREDETTLLILSDDSELNMTDPDSMKYALTVMRTPPFMD